MKKSPFAYLIPLAVLFVALGVVLYFINPLAPLLLLASLVIQVPLILLITRTSFNAGYRDRVYERRQKYEQDGDAASFLAAEEKEAGSIGFRYWSRAGRALNALNRAEMLIALGRRDEAAPLLADIDPARLQKPDKARLDELNDQS